MKKVLTHCVALLVGAGIALAVVIPVYNRKIAAISQLPIEHLEYVNLLQNTANLYSLCYWNDLPIPPKTLDTGTSCDNLQLRNALNLGRLSEWTAMTLDKESMKLRKAVYDAATKEEFIQASAKWYDYYTSKYSSFMQEIATPDSYDASDEYNRLLHEAVRLRDEQRKQRENSFPLSRKFRKRIPLTSGISDPK